jgi:uncharacterized protein with HEPN domain
VTDDDQRTDDPASAQATDAAAGRAGDAEPESGTHGKGRDPRVVLDEMLDCIDLIQRYTHGLSFEEFAAQPVIRDAVVLRIAILGEAASHLPERDRARWTNIPWRVIMDTRNRLIHGYFAVRLDLERFLRSLGERGVSREAEPAVGVVGGDRRAGDG